MALILEREGMSILILHSRCHMDALGDAHHIGDNLRKTKQLIAKNLAFEGIAPSRNYTNGLE